MATVKQHEPARKIVASLLLRERVAKRHLTNALRSRHRNEMVVTLYESIWAEAHNGAEAARRILYGARL